MARAEELQRKLEEAGESNRIITQAVRLKQDEVDELSVINSAINRQLKVRGEQSQTQIFSLSVLPRSCKHPPYASPGHCVTSRLHIFHVLCPRQTPHVKQRNDDCRRKNTVHMSSIKCDVRHVNVLMQQARAVRVDESMCLSPLSRLLPLVCSVGQRPCRRNAG